jgi:Tfp pilus assembly protein PilF
LVGTVAPVEAEALRARASDNREAYRLFLLGKALLNRRTQETVARAVEHYAEAVRLDPAFTEAWAMLAYARLIQFDWAWETEVSRDSLPVLARAAINSALALDSLAATAWAVDGILAGRVDFDFPRTRASFERALGRDSLNAETLHAYGTILGAEQLNDLGRAEEVLRRALALEPARPNTWRQLAFVLRNQGRLADAEAVLDTLVALGEWAPAYLVRSDVRFWRGDGAGALADIAEFERLSGGLAVRPRALYSIVRGDSLPARAWLEQHRGRETSRADSVWSVRLSVALGQFDEAFVLLEAYRRDMSVMSLWPWLHHPLFEPLHDDPRYLRLLEESRPEGR